MKAGSRAEHTEPLSSPAASTGDARMRCERHFCKILFAKRTRTRSSSGALADWFALVMRQQESRAARCRCASAGCALSPSKGSLFPFGCSQRGFAATGDRPVRGPRFGNRASAASARASAARSKIGRSRSPRGTPGNHQQINLLTRCSLVKANLFHRTILCLSTEQQMIKKLGIM